jgi:hypothetical protein
MLLYSTILLCIAALGIAGLAAKYLLGPAPADYHINILKHDGVDVTDGHKRVFRALYLILGCLILSLSLTLVVLALIPIAQNLLWAKLTVLFIGAVTALGACVVPFRIEKETGVRTPWRPAAGVIALIFVAVLLSFA